MKNKIKYRIVRIILGDKTTWYEVQRVTLFRKWYTCQMLKLTKSGLIELPAQFSKKEDAEKFIARNFVDPIIEVIKEY